ncbi:MAG: ABC transporter substrate-binding protein [Thermoanaerobaculales bacterium]|nr:ABC transporter substrate-binding protein [Thermoanaerobaculales bacterium]
MRTLNTLTKIGSIILVCLGLAACGSKPVIGVLLAESGEAQAYGQVMKTAMELAIEQAKADGTYPPELQIFWADSGSDPDQAAEAYRSLVSKNGAKFIVAGVTSGEAKALLPVIEKTNVPCLSPSASLPSLTKDSKLFYRIFPSDELEGRRAGRFLREDQDLNTVLIFTQDSEQAQGIEPPFRHIFEQAMEGKVVGRIVLTDPDWKKEAKDSCAAYNPESVYIVAYAEATLEVLRLLDSEGFDGVICATSAFYSGHVVEENPDLVDRVFFPQPAFDTQDERPIVQDFVNAYKATSGHDPDIYAAHAFDAMRVALATVAKTDIFETSEIKKTLQFKLEEFPGVTGIIQFNDWGDVHRNPIMFIVKDGQVRNYERYLAEEKKRIRERIRRLLTKG